MSITKNLRRVVLELHRTGTKKWSTIDSISQNEESKIAYDYAMILHNNKFKHMVHYFKEVDYLKHKTRETSNRKETLIRNFLHENMK